MIWEGKMGKSEPVNDQSTRGECLCSLPLISEKPRIGAKMPGVRRAPMGERCVAQVS